MPFRNWLLAVLISTPLTAFAASDLEELEGSTIVASGDIEPITCPITGNHDCLNWPTDQFRLASKDVCFKAEVSCGYSCSGFIAEKEGIKSVYILNAGVGPELARSDVELMVCPEEE